MFSEALSPTNLLNRPTGMLIYYTFTILAVQAAWAMSVVEWRSRKQWIYGRTLLAYSAVFTSLVLTLLAGLLPQRGFISLPAIVGPALALFDTVAIILLCWAFQSRIIGDPRAPSYLGWNLAGAGFLSLLFTLILLPWQQSGAPLAEVPAWQSQIWYAWQALLCLVACYLIYYRRRDQTGLQVISFGILAAGRLLAAGLMPGALQWSQLLGFPLLTISLYLNIVRDLKEFADELQAISTPSSPPDAPARLRARIRQNHRRIIGAGRPAATARRNCRAGHECRSRRHLPDRIPEDTNWRGSNRRRKHSPSTTPGGAVPPGSRLLRSAPTQGRSARAIGAG